MDQMKQALHRAGVKSESKIVDRQRAERDDGLRLRRRAEDALYDYLAWIAGQIIEPGALRASCAVSVARAAEGLNKVKEAR